VTGIVKGNGTALSAASAGTDYVAPGAYTTSGLTMATARLLGRTTASTGAAEEITVGTGLTLATGSIVNAAPDQVVSLTGAGTTSISGTYPSFTITSNDAFVGTVTSVGGTGTVSGLTLTGTVTTSGNLTLGGTLSVVPSDFASQTANTFLAAPNGAPGTPTFRAIVAADVPTLNQNTTGTALNVTGTVAVVNGGTGQTTYTDGQILIGNSTGNTLTKTTLTAGTNVSITNGSGAITINATDAFVGTVTSVSGTGTVNGITLTGTVTSSGSLTATELCTFECRTGRARGCKLSRAVAQHNFGIGANVDEQLHCSAAVWTFRQNCRCGVGTNVTGDAWADVIASIWKCDSDLSCQTTHRFVGRQHKWCCSQWGRIDTQQNVMHDRITDHHDLEDFVNGSCSFRCQFENEVIECCTNNRRELDISAFVHHHVRDAAHQVFAEADLWIHHSCAAQDFTCSEITQVTSNRR
jgi:hypothetical protein